MAEYRKIRETHDILTVCKTPELSAEVTMQPVQRLEIDAAIIFADILLPLEPMGLNLEFSAGEGPVIHNPVRDSSGVAALKDVDADSLRYVGDAIRLTRRRLEEQPCPIPLIGFAGAPFTLASYAIEGGSSRNYLHTKGMMYGDPTSWHALMKKLSHVVSEYLRSQIHAGAQVVQLFDSWVGCLNPNDYREYVFPHVQELISGLRNEGVPIIHFGTGTASLLELQKEAGGDVIGVDWRTHIDDAWQRLGPDVAVQGNLDPVTLFAPLPEIQRRVEDILRRAANRPGHIFNLGHGILPHTPVEHVQSVARMVHEFSARPS